MTLRLGELCAGYGGLGMAVEEVFTAETAWFSEFDAAPSKILAHHWPNVPNYGDMTKIDWANIEHVDIISGGTPCQDLSHAGKRKGMTEGTRSNLWVQMREAIAIQKPKYVVWENVRGAYSASADSDLEQCPGCVGDPADGGAVLRALGRVLGDLSDLGFHAEWRGLRAADVGAPHGRFRVFVLAAYRGGGRRNQGERAKLPGTPGHGNPDMALERGTGHLTPVTADPESLGWGEGGPESAGQLRRFDHAISGGSIDANPISSGRDGWTRATGRETLAGTTPEWAGEGASWGEYEPAIRRWEARLGRPAPRPTEPTGRDGGHRLSPRFTEWMMGLPDGWVTDPAIGISRNDQLKACGNGVVPAQAAAALRDMLAAFEMEQVA